MNAYPVLCRRLLIMRSSILRLPSDNFGSDNPTTASSVGVDGEVTGVNLTVSEVGFSSTMRGDISCEGSILSIKTG